MKIKVTCGCGSVFEAPDSLAGQVIRCPACRKPLTVPGAPAGAAASPPPASGTEPDLNDLTALDQVSLDSSGAQGSTVGRSAIRRAPKPGSRQKRDAGDSTVSDRAISQEVDDRMTRLYEVYAGKEMRIKTGGGSKLKLLIGVGIAAAAIGIGLLGRLEHTQGRVRPGHHACRAIGRPGPGNGARRDRRAQAGGGHHVAVEADGRGPFQRRRVDRGPGHRRYIQRQPHRFRRPRSCRPPRRGTDG